MILINCYYIIQQDVGGYISAQMLILTKWEVVTVLLKVKLLLFQFHVSQKYNIQILRFSLYALKYISPVWFCIGEYANSKAEFTTQL